MDKNEYRAKLDEINDLVDRQDYKGALKIVDGIDWKRVRSARTLCMVGEIYEANKRYEDSRRLLMMAHHRAPIGKMVLYRLVELSIKMENYEEAIDYYNQFVEISPNDNTRYILKYKIYRGRRSPIQEQIAILEDYKSREYTERWAFELARLYAKAGKKDKCIEECDDLILWFSEGKYVTKAMELKMKYAPLTPSQQQKYDNRYIEPTPEMRAATEAKAAATIAAATEAASRLVKNTAVLQSAEEKTDERESQSEQITDELPAIESVRSRSTGKSLEEASVFSPILETTGVLQDKIAKSIRDVLSGGARTEQIKEEEEPEEYHSPEDTRDYVVKELEPEQSAGPIKATVTGAAVKEAVKAGKQMEKAADGSAADKSAAVEELDLEALLAETANAFAQTVAQETSEREAEKEAEPVSEPETSEPEKSPEAEEVKEAGLEEEPEPTEEEPEEEPEPTEEEPEEEPEPTEEEPEEEPEPTEEEPEEEPEPTEEEPEEEPEPTEEEPEEEPEVTLEVSEEEPAESEIEIPEQAEEDVIESPDIDELKLVLESDTEEDAEIAPGVIQELSILAGNTEEPEAEPVMDDLLAGMNLEVSGGDTESFGGITVDLANALEAAAAEAAVTSEPANADEPRELKLQDTGAEPKKEKKITAPAEYAVEEILRHHLTKEEQKRFFTYFVPIPGMADQITEALNAAQESACERTSRSGNFVITGRQGSGKTKLSEGLIKAICKERKMKGAKIAYLDAEKLNGKDPAFVVDKLSGGFLVVEKAAGLKPEIIENLSKAMEFKTNRLTVILEDLKPGIQSLENTYPEFMAKFDSRIVIPVFTNDELVSFAKTYSKEMGYKIDDMAVLALYTLIGDNQNDEDPVTVAQVKEMMDDAIKHASRGGRRPGKKVAKRHLDETGRIMLYEKDFDV